MTKLSTKLISPQRPQWTKRQEYAAAYCHEQGAPLFEGKTNAEMSDYLSKHLTKAKLLGTARKVSLYCPYASLRKADYDDYTIRELKGFINAYESDAREVYDEIHRPLW